MIRLTPASGSWVLDKLGANAATTLLTGPTAASLDVAALVMAGSSLSMIVNGVSAGTVTDGTFATVTNHGLSMNRASDSASRLDDFAFYGA